MNGRSADANLHTHGTAPPGLLTLGLGEYLARRVMGYNPPGEGGTSVQDAAALWGFCQLLTSTLSVQGSTQHSEMLN